MSGSFDYLSKTVSISTCSYLSALGEFGFWRIFITVEDKLEEETMPLLRLLASISCAAILLSGCESTPHVKAPKTEKDTVTTVYFGKRVADPYRWLEDGDAQKVKDWIDSENQYTDKVLSGFSEEKALAQSIKQLSTTSVERFSPTLVNGKLFFEQFTPPQGQPVIAYKTWPDGDIKVLFDPNKEGENIAVTGFWPSPRGNYLAYGTAVGGNEATTIRILRVRDGKILSDTLPDAGGGTTPSALVWDADENGMTYVRLPAAGTVPDADLQFDAALYHHRLGGDEKGDSLVFGKDLSKVAEYTFVSSENGEHAAMFVHFGDGNPDDVYVNTHPKAWQQVLDTASNVRVASSVNDGAVWDGDTLLVVSYENAPKGALLSISPDGHSKVLIPEGDWAMSGVSAIKDGLLVTKVRGADWKVDQYSLDGKLVSTVDLPQTGIGIGTIVSSGKSDQALITYAGWKTPERWVQYDTRNGSIRTIFQLKTPGDYSKVQVNKMDAVSKDGTKVPVTVLSLEGITPNGQRPAILYGYGGFGISIKPHLIGFYLAWLENGGVLAFANIRGGGEFGEGWHEAGMLDKKQNVFDDMYAAAEAMVKNRWTDSAHLGIQGGSNGGLLMGAELTQHPHAFKAVVSFVGIYDMLRNELFPNGQYNISEYGTSTREPDFKWLYAYSPYYHVTKDTHYPSVLLETAVNDPRVAPWQSRKFAAALQSATTSDNPVLLLTRMNGGHGVTASFSQRMGNTVALMTFFAHELHLPIK